MNNIKDLEKKLPSTTKRFSIDLEGSLTKIKYEGEFECKIPTARNQAEISKYKAFLNGSSVDGLDVGTINFHHMISHLRYTLAESPDWWKEKEGGYDLYDINVVEKVYDNVLEFEKSWIIEIWGDEEETKEA